MSQSKKGKFRDSFGKMAVTLTLVSVPSGCHYYRLTVPVLHGGGSRICLDPYSRGGYAHFAG